MHFYGKMYYLVKSTGRSRMKEEKKTYTSPLCELVKADEQDVITTSPIELPIIPASYRGSDLYNL